MVVNTLPIYNIFQALEGVDEMAKEKQKLQKYIKAIEDDKKKELLGNTCSWDIQIWPSSRELSNWKGYPNWKDLKY